MAHWEYKVLSGGKMGLGSMSMLEQFLNDLGQQQWEIISWQTDPETPLKFTGLARRPIIRDIAPEEMPAAMDEKAIAAAKEEEERERQAWIETLAREREFYARAIEAENPEEEDMDEEQDLSAALFDKLRSMMKRNKGRPGASGSVSYLAKKLDKSEEDLIGALAEAGLELEDDEQDSKPREHGNDMFWLNENSRGEVWINSMPKSRYRPPKPKKTEQEAKSADGGKPADPAKGKEPPPPPEPLPDGTALLEKLRPLMRRNRGGNGLSGSLPFLSRALRHTEAELATALAALGIELPEDPKAKPEPVAVEEFEYFLSKNEKGQVWIDAKPLAGEGDKTEPTPAAGSTPTETPAGSDSESKEPDSLLAQVLPHLAKVGRTLTHSSAAADVAAALGISQATLIDGLVAKGLVVPVEPDDKPVVAEDDGNQFWFSRSPEDALALNAKPVRKGRSRTKS